MQASLARETDGQQNIAQRGLNGNRAECQEAGLGEVTQAGAFREGCLEETQSELRQEG